MILSFKQKFPWGPETNFQQKIADGVKIHSIREDKHNRWKPGRKIHMATGVRTKNYCCFDNTHKCTSKQLIRIWRTFSKYRYPRYFIEIDGILRYESSKMDQSFITILSRNDGFDSADEFFKFFNSDFSGKIIHWTDFMY